MIIAVGNERLWEKFCKVLGVEPLVKDPRFSSNAQRNVNRAGLIALLEEKLATRDAADWVDASWRRAFRPDRSTSRTRR